MATAVVIGGDEPDGVVIATAHEENPDVADYFHEVDDIQSTKDEQGDTDEELSKTPDGKTVFSKG